MSTRIRLKRIGTKKVPFYRMVVSDARSSPRGKFIESVGWYDPRTKKLEVNKERVTDWLSKGAQLSNTVSKLLKNFSIFSSGELSSRVE